MFLRFSLVSLRKDQGKEGQGTRKNLKNTKDFLTLRALKTLENKQKHSKDFRARKIIKETKTPRKKKGREGVKISVQRLFRHFFVTSGGEARTTFLRLFGDFGAGGVETPVYGGLQS